VQGRFRSQHPTYDGRGITIGHVEASLDLLLQNSRRLYTLDGKPTQKIVDYRTAGRSGALPRGYSRRSAWASMRMSHRGDGVARRSANQSYTTPRDGRFRFGIFDGKRFCDA